MWERIFSKNENMTFLMGQTKKKVQQTKKKSATSFIRYGGSIKIVRI